MLNSGLFTSARGDWRTPKALYDALDAEFHFDFDPCPANPTFDGLSMAWGERNYVNPPYGRKIGAWIEKGYREWLGGGKLVVFLVPSRTDTAWWHEWLMRASEIRFLRGRVHFDERGPAPFPSAVVVFR